MTEPNNWHGHSPWGSVQWETGGYIEPENGCGYQQGSVDDGYGYEQISSDPVQYAYQQEVSMVIKQEAENHQLGESVQTDEGGNQDENEEEDPLLEELWKKSGNQLCSKREEIKESGECVKERSDVSDESRNEIPQQEVSYRIEQNNVQQTEACLDAEDVDHQLEDKCSNVECDSGKKETVSSLKLQVLTAHQYLRKTTQHERLKKAVYQRLSKALLQKAQEIEVKTGAVVKLRIQPPWREGKIVVYPPVPVNKARTGKKKTTTNKPRNRGVEGRYNYMERSPEVTSFSETSKIEGKDKEFFASTLLETILVEEDIAIFGKEGNRVLQSSRAVGNDSLTPDKLLNSTDNASTSKGCSVKCAETSESQVIESGHVLERNSKDETNSHLFFHEDEAQVTVKSELPLWKEYNTRVESKAVNDTVGVCSEKHDPVTRKLKDQDEKTEVSCHCENCDKFKQERELEEHEGSLCGKEQHKCAYCGKEFEWKFDWKSHLRTVHNEHKSYMCPYCGNIFSQLSHRKRHISIIHKREKPFKCQVCEKKFSTKYNMHSHTSFIHLKGEGPFNCSYCEKEFALVKDLIIHINSFHKKSISFECEYCKRKFVRKNHLTRHISSVHKKEQPYKCEYCEKKFSRFGNMKSHISTVHKKEHPFECENCRKKFGKKTDLERHISTVHKKERPYDCEYCGNKFARKSDIKKHINIVHKQEHPYQCEHCGKKFWQKSNMTLHIRTVHNMEEPFQCSLCEQRFFQKRDLKIHTYSVHKIEQPYECEYCRKKFDIRSVMNRHINTVHKKEQPYQCEYCGNKFSRFSNMKSHIRTVHMKEQPYECKECKKKFGKLTDLTRHISTVHKKERPYECEYCGNMFARRSDIKKHINIVHKQEHPYQCEYCGKKFCQKSNMTKHINTVHKKGQTL